MIDKYFRKPIFWDYLLALIFSSVFIILKCRNLIKLPKENNLYSVVSDLSTIALTMAGFILTLLTVLISFKDTANHNKNNSRNEDIRLFEVFFSTELYFQTIKHLRNAIISLTIIAVGGYMLKLSLDSYPYAMYCYSLFGIVVIFFTVWRCLIILTKIMKMQQEK